MCDIMICLLSIPMCGVGRTVVSGRTQSVHNQKKELSLTPSRSSVSTPTRLERTSCSAEAHLLFVYRDVINSTRRKSYTESVMGCARTPLETEV